MSGYRWDPVFRVVPRNGGETVYWLSDRLTDVGSHTKINLKYVESMNVREDINRSLRPVVYGLRPEVEIECLILSMADQLFLKEIEDALLLPNHYNVFLSLDGGCVEREVVLANVSNAEPIRGKTVIGATFKLAVRCVDLIPRKPAMMTDPGVGAEHLQDGGFELWPTQSWEAVPTIVMTQETTIKTGGASAAKIQRVDSAFNDLRSIPAATFSLKSGAWYRYRCMVRGTVAMPNAHQLRISNSTRDREVNTDGKTWGSAGILIHAASVTTAFVLQESHFRRDPLDFGADLYTPRHVGWWTSGESLYYDDVSIFGPVLRPGVATW